MKLSVYKNNGLVKEIELLGNGRANIAANEEFFIGRSQDCHLVLENQQISRHHASIKCSGDIWEINKVSNFGDLLVNGSPCANGKLKNGDVISIGPFSINFQNIEPQSTAEMPSNVVPMTKEAAIPSSISLEEKSEGLEIENTSGSQENEIKFDENPGEAPVTEEGMGQDNFPMLQDEGAAAPGDLNEGTQFITSFAEFELEIKGTLAPYDRYKLGEDETIIGRDSLKSKIVINDPEISGTHAKIIKRKWSCSLVDLNSANGTFHNGEKINEVALNDGDVFKIGSTEFTFRIKSDLLNDEASRLMPVQENQVVLKEVEGDLGITPVTEEAPQVGAAVGAKPEKKSLVEKWKTLNQRQKIIYGSVGLLLLFLLLDETPEQAPITDAQKNEKKSHLLTEKKKEEEKGVDKNGKPKKNLTKEQLQELEAQYQLAKELFNQGKYSETIFELQKIFALTDDFKNSKQLFDWSKEGLAKLEELEKKRQAEIERKRKQEKVKELLEKAKIEVKERNVAIAESLFSQILELDPENLDVSQLKMELEAWKKEQERIQMEKAMKEAERKRQVGLLTPAKTLFLKKEWYKATIKLEEFLRQKDMDEDLIKESTEMLSEAKKNLSTLVDPMLGKARSLKEGQDLKGAYETYTEILKTEPSNNEGLAEINDIRVILDNRAKKIYREAIISESLSLFEDAREKFQEVQQISPIDSEYYIKATEKLKNYID